MVSGKCGVMHLSSSTHTATGLPLIYQLHYVTRKQGEIMLKIAHNLFKDVQLLHSNPCN